MLVRIEAEVSKNASDIDIMDKLLYELNHNGWKKVIHKHEMHKDTNLEGKCGSCAFFQPIDAFRTSCYGKCGKSRVMGQRTRRACKRYERVDE